MGSSVNRVFVVGNIGKDAEIRNVGGNSVANFSVATTEKWRDKNTGELKEETEWHRIAWWGKSVDAIGQYLTKGQLVCVEGRLQTRKWTDKQGLERYTTEIRADRVTLLGGKRDGSRSDRERPEQGSAYTGPDAPAPEDDIPF